MTLSLVRPAPFRALAAMLAADLPASARKRGVDKVLAARVNLGAGKSWGIIDEGGACIACIGLGLIEHDGAPAYEAWVACAPEASARIVGVARLAQLTLRHAGQDRPTIAWVAVGHRPGARLAAICGLSLAETSGGFQKWVRHVGDF